MNRKQLGVSTRVRSRAAVRASITFPSDLYQALTDIASQKKVSLAWVVRDAVERYVADAKTGKTSTYADARGRK